MARSGPDYLKPPEYINLPISEKEAEDLESSWDCLRPDDYLAHKANLIFEFASRKPARTWKFWRYFQPRRRQPEWHASMRVWARNIPRLMRHGFYWSPAHHRRFQNEIKLSERRSPLLSSKCSQKNHHRVYILGDDDPHREWVAELWIFSKDASTIVDFDLSWITLDTTTKAVAFNWSNKAVYKANMPSGTCFNAIYGRMPMKGRWPWPKAWVSEEDD